MSHFISKKAWGGAYVTKDNKVKVWRKPKDASQKRRWVTSKKVRAVSPKVAARLQRP